MQSDRLRVGIVSFAHVHAPAYTSALHQIPGAVFSGIWDDRPERGQQAAEHYETTFFADREQLLASVDTVIIASENRHHREHVLAAAAAGVPVLCEKPLATTLADAQAMIQACESARVALGTAFPVRYSAAVQSLRAAVQGGLLGETLMIRATNRGTYPGGWFGDPALAGGGALMDHTVHVADLLRWIWQCEFTQVYAEAATRHHEIAVDDCGLLLITLDGDLIASLDPSWSRPVNAFPTWGDVTMEVTGTGGAANLDVFAQNVEFFGNARGRTEWRGWGDNLDRLLLEDWLRSIRENAPPPISGWDGLRAAELALAAYRSAATHLPVALPLVYNQQTD
ncbi:MAG TPA: Gfo/Idh/MocA family oxidoreductase [Herpetosiphonaceae bacterium]